MEIQKDFKELLELFNSHNVEYMIVGGYALAFHGAPRYTGDLDIFINPSTANAQRILKALGDFGFGSLRLVANDFTTSDKIVQLGVSPVRIDIITSITGISWEQAVKNRVEGYYGNTKVFFISRADFITNKKALSRQKDLADIEALGEKVE